MAEELAEIMVEKGLPARTVDRIETENYVSMMRNNQSSVIYNPNRVLNENYLNIRNSNLGALGIDLREKKVCYNDQFGLTKLGYSTDGFETSIVLDEKDIPWVVDTVDESSYYFNTEMNQFYPNYNPEVVDPMDLISQIWEETKRETGSSRDNKSTLI